jgi:hypothetical protein
METELVDELVATQPLSTCNQKETISDYSF